MMNTRYCCLISDWGNHNWSLDIRKSGGVNTGNFFQHGAGQTARNRKSSWTRDPSERWAWAPTERSERWAWGL